MKTRNSRTETCNSRCVARNFRIKTCNSRSEVRKYIDVDYEKFNPEYDALEEFWRQKEEEENEEEERHTDTEQES